MKETEVNSMDDFNNGDTSLFGTPYDPAAEQSETAVDAAEAAPASDSAVPSTDIPVFDSAAADSESAEITADDADDALTDAFSGTDGGADDVFAAAQTAEEAQAPQQQPQTQTNKNP